MAHKIKLPGFELSVFDLVVERVQAHLLSGLDCQQRE